MSPNLGSNAAKPIHQQPSHHMITRHPARICAAITAALTLMTGFEAAALNIVNVNAPAINCLFNASCKVTVNDSTGPIHLPGTTGSGFLQSRTFPGQPGTPEAGLTAYEYRIDLTQINSVNGTNGIRSLALDFGPVKSGDYNSSGVANQQVFVVKTGGLGSVGPSSAVQSGRTVTFTFNPPVRAGIGGHPGQSSYFFGMVASNSLPTNIVANAIPLIGTNLALPVRTPGR